MLLLGVPMQDGFSSLSTRLDLKSPRKDTLLNLSMRCSQGGLGGGKSHPECERTIPWAGGPILIQREKGGGTAAPTSLCSPRLSGTAFPDREPEDTAPSWRYFRRASCHSNKSRNLHTPCLQLGGREPLRHLRPHQPVTSPR